MVKNLEVEEVGEFTYEVRVTRTKIFPPSFIRLFIYGCSKRGEKKVYAMVDGRNGKR